METEVTDINLVEIKDITLSFSEEQNLWIARDAGLNILGTGRDTISLPGVKVQIIGATSDNDDFVLSPASNYQKPVLFAYERRSNRRCG